MVRRLWKPVITATAWATGLLVLLAPVKAETPTYGWTFDHAVISHSGDPTLDALVGEALSVWGKYSAIRDGGLGADIRIWWGDIDAAGITYPWGARETVMRTPPGCQITIRPSLPESYWRLVVMHEVGHCLGMDHVVDVRCTMNAVPLATCMEELVTMGRLYPNGGYRLIVPGVSAASLP